MVDLLGRLLFVTLLAGLYFAGAACEDWVEQKAGAELEAKTLMPIIALVFLDRYLRLLSTWAVSIATTAQLSDEALRISVRLRARGQLPLDVDLLGAEGVRGASANVECPGMDPIVPEDYRAVLTTSTPSRDLDIVYSFRERPIPNLAIPLPFGSATLELYCALLTFNVAGWKRHRRIRIARLYRR